MMASVSIVEYFSEHSGYRCGYCKSTDTNYSHGMWAHKLMTNDYQDLIDRGWRRSGQYCYKPSMNMTCCPQYTIRCDALNFHLSKSQKKVLKRMHKFLAYGRDKNDEIPTDDKKQMDFSSGENVTDYPDSTHVKNIAKTAEKNLQNKTLEEGSISGGDYLSEDSSSAIKYSVDRSTQVIAHKTNPRKGDGANPDKPQPKKAKLIRRERKLNKLLAKANQSGESVNVEELLHKKKPTPVKSLEDFLNEPLPDNPAHKLQIKLIKANLSSEEFQDTFEVSFEVYKLYQMGIHKEKESECDEKTFIDFLNSAPFPDKIPGKRYNGFCGYGSFHQQYWLDDKLIAVGVIDILPHCLSSVYLYYDPSYSFLSLGTYGALREIALTRELNRLVPNLKYYYMGFYIHSCPKMRYKGQFAPSQLLCPEVYNWHPIENCRPKLDVSKYSRLEDDKKAEDKDGIVDLNSVQILYQRKQMPYIYYTLMKQNDCDKEVVTEYARFVGKTCYKRMLLYRA